VKAMTKKFICNFDEPIVKTKKGKLRGYLWGNIYHFLGVRYGKAKRFLPPEPEQAWDGVKDAIVYGEGPLVAFEEKAMGLCGYESMLSQKQFWPRSEDCLNLNIWTPSIDPAAEKPVMVWIMGGGFHAGAANESAALDGSNLSEFGDAVVVSVNHRISLLGFFDLAPFGENTVIRQTAV